MDFVNDISKLSKLICWHLMQDAGTKGLVLHMLSNQKYGDPTVVTFYDILSTN